MKINQIIVALVLMVAIHFKSEAQNLVVNGGFETGNFNGWSETSYLENPSIFNTMDGVVHSGSYAAAFYEVAVFEEGFYQLSEDTVSQTLPTTSGASYLLSFWWVNSLFPGNTGECSVYWNGSLIFQQYISTSGWTNIQLVVSAPGTNTILEFAFQTGLGSPSSTALDDVSVAQLYHVTGQLLSGGDMQLSFVGMAGTNYALDRTFNLAPLNWVPQATNPAGAGGVLVFTNTPDPATNNFWRIRSVP